MHHMAVPLDYQQISNLNRSMFGDPAHIVTTQVDKHEMLGSFFRVCQQFFFKCQILLLGCSPFPCPGNGTKLDDISLLAYQNFRR